MAGIQTSRHRVLCTARLILEPLEVEYARELYQPLTDPELYRFLPQQPPESVDELRARFSRLLAPECAARRFTWLARYGGSAIPVGMFQARLDDECFSLGYRVFRPWWRMGFATEAVDGIGAHLDDDYGVTALSAVIDTRNRASIRVAEKLGFELSGTVPHADFFAGAWSHQFHYRRGGFAIERGVAGD